MKNYIGIMKLDNGVKIPAMLETANRAEALLKLAKYCNEEGYFPIEIEVIDIMENIGLIKI